jgi:hypothetical protein
MPKPPNAWSHEKPHLSRVWPVLLTPSSLERFALGARVGPALVMKEHPR